MAVLSMSPLWKPIMSRMTAQPLPSPQGEGPGVGSVYHSHSQDVRDPTPTPPLRGGERLRIVNRFHVLAAPMPSNYSAIAI